jgi:hypothetical protein
MIGCIADDWHLSLYRDVRGDRRIEGVEGFLSGSVSIGAINNRTTDGLHLTLRPVVASAGGEETRSLTRVVAIQLFNSNPQRPLEQFAAFERRIMDRYYTFMLPARWRYMGLYELHGGDASFPYTRAEPYVIEAETIEEAKELDAVTSPEPPDILEIYEECRAYKDGSQRWLWLVGTQ